MNYKLVHPQVYTLVNIEHEERYLFQESNLVLALLLSFFVLTQTLHHLVKLILQLLHSC